MLVRCSSSEKSSHRLLLLFGRGAVFFLLCSIYGVPQIKDKQNLHCSVLVMLLPLAARGADSKELPWKTRTVLLFHLKYYYLSKF